jgi:uncharacterized protein (TIGR02594 family)
MTVQDIRSLIDLNPVAAIWMETALRYHGVREGDERYIRDINSFSTTTTTASTPISVETARERVLALSQRTTSSSISGIRGRASAQSQRITAIAASLPGRPVQIHNNGVGEENAWCSAFVNHVMITSIGSGTHDIGAGTWRNWGYPLPMENIPFGAILVFRRGPRNHHVGFYVRKRVNYFVYGGNQRSDILTDVIGNNGIVGVTTVGKNNLLSVRWPFSHEAQNDSHTPVVRRRHRHRH